MAGLPDQGGADDARKIERIRPDCRLVIEPLAELCSPRVDLILREGTAKAALGRASIPVVLPSHHE